MKLLLRNFLPVSLTARLFFFFSLCICFIHILLLTYVTQHGFLWSYNRDALAHKP